MPNVYHTGTSALVTPARFPADCLVVDARYQRQDAPWRPSQVEAMFPSRYVHATALGSQACSNSSFTPTPQVIAWQEGLAQVQAAAPTADVVVLCHCPEQSSRCHRQLVCRELAAALGKTDGGPLP